jgi:hypothetical protein
MDPTWQNLDFGALSKNCARRALDDEILRMDLWN